MVGTRGKKVDVVELLKSPFRRKPDKSKNGSPQTKTPFSKRSRSDKADPEESAKTPSSSRKPLGSKKSEPHPVSGSSETNLTQRASKSDTTLLRAAGSLSTPKTGRKRGRSNHEDPSTLAESPQVTDITSEHSSRSLRRTARSVSRGNPTDPENLDHSVKGASRDTPEKRSQDDISSNSKEEPNNQISASKSNRMPKDKKSKDVRIQSKQKIKEIECPIEVKAKKVTDTVVQQETVKLRDLSPDPQPKRSADDDGDQCKEAKRLRRTSDTHESQVVEAIELTPDDVTNMEIPNAGDAGNDSSEFSTRLELMDTEEITKDATCDTDAVIEHVDVDSTADLTPQADESVQHDTSENQTEIHIVKSEEAMHEEDGTQSESGFQQVIMIMPEAEDEQGEVIGTTVEIAETDAVEDVGPQPTRQELQALNSFEVLVEVASQEDDVQSQNVIFDLSETTSETQLVEKDAPDEQAQQQALPLVVLVPHASILPSAGPPPLKVCEDSSCRCNLVHCPLCAPGRIGVASKKLMTRHFGVHKKRGVNYGDHHIYLCMLECHDEPHLHCPMCGSIVLTPFHQLSTFLIHLTACENLLKKGEGSVKDIKLEPKDDSVAPSALIVPHASILKEGESLSIENCEPGNGCNCGLFHCPLCVVEKQTFRFKSKGMKHLEFHEKHFVPFQDYKILICQLSCTLLSHYHCPMCGNTFRRKIDVSSHIAQRCRGVTKKRRMRKSLLMGPGADQDVPSPSQVQPRKSHKNRQEETVVPSFYSKVKHMDKQHKETSSTSVMDVLNDEISHPHESIIPKDRVLKPQLCDENIPECQCGLYHCPLCPIQNIKWAAYSRMLDHVHTHYKKRVPFNEYMVLACGLACVPDRPAGFHYHCPKCGVVIILHEHFQRHFFRGCRMKKCYTDNVLNYPSHRKHQKAKKSSVRQDADQDTDTDSAVKGKAAKAVQVPTRRSARRLVKKTPESTNSDVASISDTPVVKIKQEPETEDGVTDEELDLLKQQLLKQEGGSTCDTFLKCETGLDGDMTDMVDQTDSGDKHSLTEDPKLLEKKDVSKPHPNSQTKPKEILQSVSALINKELLDGITVIDNEANGFRVIDHEVVLEALQVHTGIGWSLTDSQDRWCIHGSWEQLEKASKIITQLLDKQLASEEGLFSFIKEAVDPQDTNEPSVDPADAAMDSIIVDVDTTAACNDPTADEAYTKINEANTETSIFNYTNAEKVETVTFSVTEPKTDSSIDECMDACIQGDTSMAISCPTCNKQFQNLKFLIMHLVNITKCWQSEGTESVHPGLERMIPFLKMGDSLECPTCNRKFLQKPNCIIHILSKTCSKNWQHMKIREYNIKVDLISGMYTCSQCMYSTKARISMLNHFEQHHLVKTFQCSWPSCRKTFGSQECLDTHMTRLHCNPNLKKVQCHICGITITSANIENHILSKHTDHTSEADQVKCDLCPYTTWSRVNLQNHIANKHSTPKFPCTKCDKQFARKSLLTQHVNYTHLKLKNYQVTDRTTVQCPTCNLVLYQRNLYRHIRTVHDKIKQYKCNKCDKSFTSKKSKWTHSLTHLVDTQNERMYLYRCAVCLKGFNRKWWFTEHVQYAHSGSKKYVCDVCSKAFRFKVLYQRHMLAHEDTSTQCDICQQVFSQTRLLRAHLRNKHNIKGVVSCACGLHFTSMEAYQVHEQKCESVHEMQANLPIESGEEITVEDDGSEQGIIKEIIVSDGIQYETRVIQEQEVFDQYQGHELVETETTALEHLEAAQTLESIALVAPDANSESMEHVTLAEGIPEQVIVTTEDGQVLMTSQEAQNIMIKTEEGEEVIINGEEVSESITIQQEEQIYASIPDSHTEEMMEELQESPSQTVVIQTETGQQVELLIPEGQTLSEEDTRNIILEMQAHETLEQEQVSLESVDDAVPDIKSEHGDGQHSDSEAGNGGMYMCGMCSQIYPSLEDVELHINTDHEVATEDPQE